MPKINVDPNKIRLLRESQGMTLEQVSGLTGLSPGFLSMLERGERGYSQKSLKKIAKALKTAPGNLLLTSQNQDEEIWSIWSQANPDERRQITDIAKVLVKAKT